MQTVKKFDKNWITYMIKTYMSVENYCCDLGFVWAEVAMFLWHNLIGRQSFITEFYFKRFDQMKGLLNEN